MLGREITPTGLALLGCQTTPIGSPFSSDIPEKETRFGLAGERQPYQNSRPRRETPKIEKSMRIPSRGRQYAALGLAGALCTLTAAGEPLGSAEEAFIAENRVAMDKMMGDMDVKPSGDVDQDFAAMMIPHHQGAIDMAQAELRYGQNVRLRRIAQEIIVDQQQEIAAMRLALDQPAPPPQAAPDQPGDAAPAGAPTWR